jgi:hypothetical protein
MQQQLSPNAILHAVSIKLTEAQQRHQHVLAEIARLREQIDDYGNVIRQPGPAGRDGLDGKDGLAGKNGLDGVHGRNGNDGLDGANGKDGLDGKNGDNGLDGEPGRDGRDGLPGRDGSKGERGEHGEKGEMGEQGQRGETGAPGARGEQGEKGEPGADAYPGQARGLWSAEADYRQMDVVSYNGSEWRAIQDDPGALPGPGWMLGAKGIKGRPGERGERGERGPQGPMGPAGIGIDEVVLNDFTLVFLCSDGSTMRCDLAPAFERYRMEVS